MMPVKIAVILALVGAMVIGVISDAYHVFLIVVMLLFLPLLLWGYAQYSAKHISIALKTEKKTVMIGEPVPMTLEVQNSAWFSVPNLRISLQCENGFLPRSEKQIVTASVRGGKIRKIAFTMESQHVGRIKLEILEAVLFDPIGMFCKRLAVLQSASIFVIPECQVEVVPHASIQSAFFEEDVFSNEKPGFDSSETFAIRPYREGDLPRQLHWKLSARMDEPMVREFSHPMLDRFILFADFYAENLSEQALLRLDDMLKKLFSLSMGLAAQTIYHSIMWYDYQKSYATQHRIETLDDVYKAMQEILGMTLYDGMALGEELCPKGSGVFYFSPNKDWNGEGGVIV